MGRRRTGYIRERGGRFEVEVAGDHFGVFDTPEEAERIRRAVLADGEGRAPNSFDLFGETWMVHREIDARRRRRTRSFDKDLSRWRAHVATASWFTMPVKRITPKLIQQWVHALSKKEALDTITFGRGEKKRVEHRPTGRNLSRKVVREALGLVQLCLDEAVTEGILDENPARKVKLPREDPREVDGELIRHLSAAEIYALFALDLPAFQRAVYAIAIYAGLRRGEIWGLRWQDVLLEGARPELRVRRSYNGPTKTRNSVRDVPLLPPALAALKAWRAAQPALPIGGALVFPNEDGKCFGPSYAAGWPDKRQRRGGKIEVTKGWRSRAGIRAELAFKELRHTCGCHLVQGTWTRAFDLHEAKTWLGHSSIAVTERHYATLTKHNLHNAVAERAYPVDQAPPNVVYSPEISRSDSLTIHRKRLE